MSEGAGRGVRCLLVRLGLPRKITVLALGAAAIALLLFLAFQRPVQDAVREWWYIHRLQSSDTIERMNAARILGEMRSVKAIPGLVKIAQEALDQGELPSWLLEDLASIGPAGIRAAVDSLRSTERDPPSEIFNLLSSTENENAIPCLIDLLKHPNSEIRSWAATELRRKGPAARDAFPDLRKAIRDEDPSVRESVYHALARIGPAARGALPDLLDSLWKDDHDRWTWAAFALSMIDPQAKVVGKVLQRAARTGSAEERKRALHALFDFLEKANDFLPLLLEGLEDRDPEVREEVVGLFAGMERPREIIVPRLTQTLADPVPAVRWAAVESLQELGEFPNEMLGPCLEVLRDNEDPRRPDAINYLSRIGAPVLRDQAPGLFALLGDADEEVSDAAFEALMGIGDGLCDFLPAINEALAASRPEVSNFAGEMLTMIEPPSESTLSDLREALKNPDDRISEGAARYCIKRSTIAWDDVPELRSALIRMMKTRGSWNEPRDEAIGLLTKMGAAAVPDLNNGLRSADPEVRDGCLRALEKLGISPGSNPESNAETQSSFQGENKKPAESSRSRPRR